jgi:hypothetical protein
VLSCIESKLSSTFKHIPPYWEKNHFYPICNTFVFQSPSRNKFQDQESNEFQMPIQSK